MTGIDFSSVRGETFFGGELFSCFLSTIAVAAVTNVGPVHRNKLQLCKHLYDCMCPIVSLTGGCNLKQ